MGVAYDPVYRGKNYSRDATTKKLKGPDTSGQGRKLHQPITGSKNKN
jgi:hypothetical protein